MAPQKTQFDVDASGLGHGSRTMPCGGIAVANCDISYCVGNNIAGRFAFSAEERLLPVYQFATPDNRNVTHLDEFAEKFLAKCTLGQMIGKYMVLLVGEQTLLMMRPYQIYAVQNIVECIDEPGEGAGATATSGTPPTACYRRGGRCG